MDSKRARQASLLALLQRHQGGVVSRATITSSIEGYTGSDEAVRKMLQRDLDDLEKTCDLSVEYQGSGPRTGYKVQRSPLTLNLDSQDLAMLSFVAGTLGPEDRALLHVEALGASNAGPTGVIAPLRTHPLLALFIQAIEERREVSFSYSKSGGLEPQERRVRPWKLMYRGGWYLIGHCLDRMAERRFKLSRMIDQPTLGEATGYDIPNAIAGIAEPWAAASEFTARISVDPGQVRAITRRLGGKLIDGGADKDDWPVTEVPYGDSAALAGFLVGFGDAVRVLEPQELRQAVVDRLDRIIDAMSSR